jgi:hypothetical protein
MVRLPHRERIRILTTSMESDKPSMPTLPDLLSFDKEACLRQITIRRLHHPRV